MRSLQYALHMKKLERTKVQLHVSSALAEINFDIEWKPVGYCLHQSNDESVESLIASFHSRLAHLSFLMIILIDCIDVHHHNRIKGNMLMQSLVIDPFFLH